MKIMSSISHFRINLRGGRGQRNNPKAVNKRVRSLVDAKLMGTTRKIPGQGKFIAFSKKESTGYNPKAGHTLSREDKGL